MNRDKLKRTVEDIEATEKAIKDLSAHKRDVYTGVKDEFDPKVLRKIIARRKMDPESRTKDDDLLDQYENALGMTGNLAKAVVAGDLTYEEAAKEADVSRRTMARHVVRAKAVPKAAETGAAETGSATRSGDGLGDALSPDSAESNADPLRESGRPPVDSTDAARLRAQKESSTDPEWLEREANACGGTPSDRASETLEATVSEGPAHRHATGDAGTAEKASLGAPLKDVASRCEPGPQDLSDPWESALASKARLDALKAARGIA